MNAVVIPEMFQATKVRDMTLSCLWYNLEDEDGSFIEPIKQQKGWHKGTALYKLNFAVTVIADGFATSTEFVIVAFTPKAIDHGKPETTVFAANENGTLFGAFEDKDSPDEEDHIYVRQLDIEEAEFEHCRVVGRYDPEKALEKLGYTLIG
jgi:hypothetical protein